ncbi:MAG: ECF transporter S component [Candidatus Cloacimonetes bacterium]|nr:ECF transporter S component [Candidatus Cloacimonadota bacterium]
MKWLIKYSSQDLLYIAIFSALGLAIKPIITPLVRLISSPLMIPGGSLAGGLYMMWLTLAVVIVKKPGAGFLVGLVQAIVMISLGFFGSHGAISLISYTMPGLVADITAFLLIRKDAIYAHILICTFANITGIIIVSILFLRLAFIPIIISIFIGSFSGIIGGFLSYSLFIKLKKYRIIGND